jgi:hypothetical protein
VGRSSTGPAAVDLNAAVAEQLYDLVGCADLLVGVLGSGAEELSRRPPG